MSQTSSLEKLPKLLRTTVYSPQSEKPKPRPTYIIINYTELLQQFVKHFIYDEPEHKIDKISDLRNFGNMTRQFFNYDNQFYINYVLKNFDRYATEIYYCQTFNLTVEKITTHNSILIPVQNICRNIAAEQLEQKMLTLRREKKITEKRLQEWYQKQQEKRSQQLVDLNLIQELSSFSDYE